MDLTQTVSENINSVVYVESGQRSGREFYRLVHIKIDGHITSTCCGVLGLWCLPDVRMIMRFDLLV